MATVVAAVQGPGNSQKNQRLSAIGLLAAAVLYTNALHGNKRIWIMNRASHNPSGSARQTEPLANQLDRVSVPCDDETSQMSSAGQGREGYDAGNSRSSRAFNGDCADLVHELANTTTAVLMNAQVLGMEIAPLQPFETSAAGNRAQRAAWQ